MKPFIFGSFSALLVLTTFAPVTAQTPGASDRPGMAGETDQGIPGVTNQGTPGDPDRGGTNNQGVPAFPNQTTPNSNRENRNNQPNLNTPGNSDRPGMAGETDQGVPGVTNQRTPGDPDQGGTNNQGVPAFPNQTIPNDNREGRNDQPYLNAPGSMDRPGMPGETDQGIPGVTNQRTPGDPDQGGTNNQGVPAFPNQTPGTINRRSSETLRQTPYQGSNQQGYVSAFQPTPFQLVNLARNGYLEGAGIPQGFALVTSYVEGEISAEDVVQGAISLNRLDPNTLEDDTYLYGVDRQLWGLRQPID